MATAQDLQRIALSLEGTTAAPHFDRTAFKVARIYATLVPDGGTANLKLSLDEQEFRCAQAPDAFSPVPGGWGRMGYTEVRLAALTVAQLEEVLRVAWQSALPTKRSKKAR
jgi:hypothetical protein